MSSEIVPVVEGNVTPFVQDAEVSFRTNGNQALDLLDPLRALNPKVTIDLIGGDYHTKQFLASEKGHKYVKQFNPTLISVKPLLKSMKEPSVLLLRGCDLMLQSNDFPFDKFKSLTALEISGCRHLTTLPQNTISEMTHLQSLDLSHLQINHLPDDFFTNAANLRSLILRGCSNLHFLPEPRRLLTRLQCVDFSHLPIKTLPDGFMPPRLRSLVLRGCSKLHSLHPANILDQLNFLDLSHCTSLQTLKPITSVQVLDISYTALDWEHVARDISHLFFRNAKVSNPILNFRLNCLKVCDLSGAENLVDISMINGCHRLEALNLSRTGIESIGFLSGWTCLVTLILRECTRLKGLPTIRRLYNLQILDLSGCKILGDVPEGLSNQRELKELNLCGCSGLRELREGLFDEMSSLEKLDLSKTNFKKLPSFSNLISIGTMINLSDSDTSDLSNLETMSLAPQGSDSIDANRHEFHLVSTFISKSGFDRFRYEFSKLSSYISELEDSLISVVHTAVPSTWRSRFGSMRVDLQYILYNIDLLESSQNCTSCEELLHDLMNFHYHIRDDLSSKFQSLLRTVAKLKLLVPPRPRPPSKKESAKKRNNKVKPPFLTAANTEIEDYAYVPYIEIYKRELVEPYESLTNIQRNCLLYFAGLPVPIIRVPNKPIKESILIHLWYGEGFFDPLLCANPIPSTIQEIGREILQALQVNGFIKIKGGEKWYMDEAAHSFVITNAIEEHLFDFNERGKLSPEFSVSRRACLLRSEVNCLSSSQTWLSYTKSPEKLELLKTVRTLLYVDEPVVDIKPEWFSTMQSLSVLHLVNLWAEQANIVDLNFLEELKNMKQLRLLNLESFSAIQKLPDSICQLTNLRILNLKYCTNLKELPAGIASLQNLIILDLTQCHLLPELPKGLASLSKLEVLKGFVITYGVGGRQSRKACTLRDLLKLDALRKLNIVVNKDSFPATADLHALSKMKNLCNLQITWSKNLDEEQQQELCDTRQSRWKQLKCWEPHNDTDEEGEEEEQQLRSNGLGNVKKLVLCCFPSEAAPNWLHPTEMQKLEKLYIVGGKLKTLLEDDTKQSTWKVKTLRFKYLSNLDMDLKLLRGIFPNMTSFDQQRCPRMQNS